MLSGVLCTCTSIEDFTVMSVVAHAHFVYMYISCGQLGDGGQSLLINVQNSSVMAILGGNPTRTV